VLQTTPKKRTGFSLQSVNLVKGGALQLNEAQYDQYTLVE